jgi:Cof subfamily protein (haloacid dehalogenase superfamily)
MTPPRLIATDLDGTLLRRDGTVSERTRAALAACRQAGIGVVFVTARPPRVMHHIVEQAGHAATAICANGAIVHDFAAAATTYVHEFAVDTARAIVDALRPTLPDAGFALETGEQVWHDGRYRIGLLHDTQRFAAEPWDAVWGKMRRVVKILARSEVWTADEMLAAALATLTVPAEVSHSGGRGLVEIAPPGSTKASTLAWYCAERGIAAHEVAAFGDMPNDLPMLAWAGSSYAVANAHPDVLRGAGAVTASHDDDGVAAVIESLLNLGPP